MSSTKNRVISVYDKHANFLYDIESLSAAAKHFDVGKSNIFNCCNGITYTVRGHILTYKGDPVKPVVYPKRNRTGLHPAKRKSCYNEYLMRSKYFGYFN